MGGGPDRFVLCGPDDDPIAARRYGAFHGQRIGFGAAADERHLSGRRPGELGDIRPPALNDGAGRPARRMGR